MYSFYSNSPGASYSKYLDVHKQKMMFKDKYASLKLLDRLVDSGNTVIVIEHNMDMVRNADWVIDLGPEGGSMGGQVMFAGTPAGLKKDGKSITSQYV